MQSIKSEQLNQELSGKIIKDIIIELDVMPSGGFPDVLKFSDLDKIIGQKVINADNNNIFVENGYFVNFCYQYDRCIGYFKNGEEINIVRKNMPKGGAFSVKFIFEDGCLVLLLNQWSCVFRILPASNYKKPCEIDILDENDFIIDNFKNWLNSHPKTSVLEACVLKEGAFNLMTGIMLYILWQSGVHPKSKAQFLSEKEINLIYNNLNKMVLEYKNGERRFGETDLYGKYHEAINVVTFAADKFAKPCPVCGTDVDISTARGTHIYFCPSCQPLKMKNI